MKLSIIIPVYNEEKTIKNVIEIVEALPLKNMKKEIIIVDDGSTDNTSKILAQAIKKKKNFVHIRHKKNMGKGAAIRSAIKKASGDYFLTQDADLEYHPSTIPKLLEPIVKNNAQIIYGTRLKRWPNFLKEERTLQFFTHYSGNRVLSFIVSMLYGSWLTDIETGYKVIPKKFFQQESFTSNGFEIEVEITVKLLKRGYTITEVPITTDPRGYKEGKKLKTIPDGIKALQRILIHRFID